jgi:uncharacterized protein YhaN
MLAPWSLLLRSKLLMRTRNHNYGISGTLKRVHIDLKYLRWCGLTPQSWFCFIPDSDSAFITLMISMKTRSFKVKSQLSLWQNLDTLQKRKTELEEQLNSLNEKAKGLAHALEQMMKIVEQTLENQEGRLHKLEEQIKEKSEAVSKLESSIVELEQTLTRTMGMEPVGEEPSAEEISVEPETQPVEVAVQTTASDNLPEQDQEPENRQREERKRRRWG